jgi:SulP family sulfate permease
MKLFDFKPKLFSTLQNYSKESFMADLMAGIIVGIVALPLAIAFGIASGVSPEKGIITAIVAGFIISLLGGSKVQIGGPTGAFIVIIYGIIQQYGISGLTVATLMAGVILILLGVFKLGAVIKFIPYPIIVGFTSGIALTIFTTQIADVFGMKEVALDENGAPLLTAAGELIMKPLKTPGDFLGKWAVYFQHLDSINWWNALISFVSVFIIAITPKFSKKIPGSLVAIVLMTVVVYLMKMYGGITCIDTIGDRFTIQSQLPEPVVPDLNWDVIKNLFPVAITIAVLGAIESLLSAAVADGVIGDRHDSNTELIAQGAANIVAPLFGGIPATGAIARTMTNINNGGRTPVAGIIHAIVLLLILLFLMPLAQYIPMACLAGVLVVVSYNMSGWRTFKGLLKNPKSDVTVLFITFFLTVIFDLTVAIETGLVIACVLFMKRVMETTEISVIRDEIDPSIESDAALHEEHLMIPDGVEVYEINGPYFFGIATKFEEVMSELGDRPKVRIVRMRKVPFIDSTGIHNLANLCSMSQKENITIVLSGVNEKVHKTLEKAGFYAMLGEENICPNIHVALERAKELLK